MKTKDKWIEIGKVGVDSGNLMVCDPCYIDSEWRREEFVDIRQYRDVETKQVFEFRKDFKHFAEELKAYKGKTPNELLKDGIWEEMPEKKVEGFSYNSVCNKGKEMFKQLNYEIGHPGVAVAFNSGLGDGSYKVMARVGIVKGGWGKRIKEIRIKLI